MARGIVLRLADEESSFGFVKVDREKLYGRKQRVVVDETGMPCQAAWLTADGTALVPTGGTAHVWLDERWSSTEVGARRAVDVEGKAVDVHPSTLGVPQPAAIVPPERVLDCVTSSVYQLLPEQLGAALSKALAGGAIVEVPFNYRDGFERETLFVVQNDEGIFALVGRATGFPMLSRHVTPELEAPGAEDELEGDLDFSMM